jgi:hypothetical protein
VLPLTDRHCQEEKSIFYWRLGVLGVIEITPILGSFLRKIDVNRFPLGKVSLRRKSTDGGAVLIAVALTGFIRTANYSVISSMQDGICNHVNLVSPRDCGVRKGRRLP